MTKWAREKGTYTLGQWKNMVIWCHLFLISRKFNSNMYNFEARGLFCFLVLKESRWIYVSSGLWHCYKLHKCIYSWIWSDLNLHSTESEVLDPLSKSNCLITKLLLLSRFSRVQLCVTPQTAAHQAPPSMGFARQEYWSGVPSPSPPHHHGQPQFLCLQNWETSFLRMIKRYWEMLKCSKTNHVLPLNKYILMCGITGKHIN